MVDQYCVGFFLVFSGLVGALDASAGDAAPIYK
jgi:hypothetical protein